MLIQADMWQPPHPQDPFTAFVVEHADCRLVVVPERGGKIVSLRQRSTGKEWLWLNEALPWHPLSPEDSYTARHDVGGWDECFPTVAPTSIGGRQWPDHGDLWWRPWQVTPHAEMLEMQVEGPGYRFERHIYPAPQGFRFSYAVTNQSDTALPYLWCAHPLLCLDPPLTIELLGRPRVLLGSDGKFGKPGDLFRWPLVGGRNFEQVGKPSKLAVKMFVEMQQGVATVTDVEGRRLQLRWPVHQLPMLGLWVNEQGWSGATDTPYCNLGLEPASGAPDDLAVAVHEWECAQQLAPGARAEWWLQVLVSDEDG